MACALLQLRCLDSDGDKVVEKTICRFLDSTWQNRRIIRRHHSEHAAASTSLALFIMVTSDTKLKAHATHLADNYLEDHCCATLNAEAECGATLCD